MLLIACAATGDVTERAEFVTVDTSCTWARPIYISSLDVLTDTTAKAILAHNETGAKRCGWRRTGKK
ncbi:hypothetical protein CAL20_09925 [Bordetella genomosp. 4]|uniref:Uncharacterized protein n=1 Tax=Bordetella genomosp. 4 TaxID=463044 RepID=A0A261U8E2_9BORD|nr:hypothetical protein CAL20_09925 [Bordetella genomosp. 4]